MTRVVPSVEEKNVREKSLLVPAHTVRRNVHGHFDDSNPYTGCNIPVEAGHNNLVENGTYRYAISMGSYLEYACRLYAFLLFLRRTNVCN